MDILIISTNQNNLPIPVMPMGACMVADAAERAGHRVKVLDLMFKGDPLHVLESELSRVKPDIVGLSIRNIDNNDIQHPAHFVRELIPLIKTIRKKTEATIILGGSAVSVMPEELLRFTGAAWAVLGDGEVVFPRLLNKLSRGETPRHIPGIAWIEDDVFRKNPCLTSNFSDDCSVPHFQRWIDVKAYLSRLSTVPIQTRLGCHFQCVYCTYRKIEGMNYRLFKPESVIDAVRRLVAMGLRDIEFVDNVFNSPYDHAMAICEGLTSLRSDVRLQSIELNPLFIDDALITAMEQAGFVGIGITVESASNSVLEGLRKGFTAEDVHGAAEVISRHKLPCLWIFMLGGPGETETTIKETLKFAENCIGPEDVAFFNVGIRIYPGTELESLARKQSLLSLPSEEMLTPVFYISPHVDFEWMIKEVKNAVDKHMNFMDSDSIALPFLPTIQRLVYRLGIRSPLWRYAPFIRRGLRFLRVHA